KVGASPFGNGGASAPHDAPMLGKLRSQEDKGCSRARESRIPGRQPGHDAHGDNRRNPARDTGAELAVSHPRGEQGENGGKDGTVKDGEAERPAAHIGRVERGGNGAATPFE